MASRVTPVQTVIDLHQNGVSVIGRTVIDDMKYVIVDVLPTLGLVGEHRTDARTYTRKTFIVGDEVLISQY